MIILSLISILCLFELYLNYRQANYVNNLENDKYLSNEEFIEFKRIELEEIRFDNFSKIISLFTMALFILFGFDYLKQFFEPSSILSNAMFILAFFMINIMFSTILSYYKKMVIDTKNGFNKQTPAMFFKDLLKALLLVFVFGGILIYALLCAIAYLGEYWWFAGFILMVVFSLAAAIVYPNFIVPIFNKLTLIEGDLSDKITDLLDKSGFKSKGVYSMDASKDDTRLNAYFAGLFGTKKVVLYDTLIDAMKENELLAVLAHELGHFKNKDIYRMLSLNVLMLFIVFAVFGKFDDFFAKDLGLEGFLASKFFAFLFFSNFIMFLFNPIINFISRKQEFNADKNGVLMCSKDDMINALKILATKNKVLTSDDKIFELVYSSHPSLSRRIDAINKL